MHLLDKECAARGAARKMEATGSWRHLNPVGGHLPVPMWEMYVPHYRWRLQESCPSQCACVHADQEANNGPVLLLLGGRLPIVSNHMLKAQNEVGGDKTLCWALHMVNLGGKAKPDPLSTTKISCGHRENAVHQAMLSLYQCMRKSRFHVTEPCYHLLWGGGI